jgi:truncated hemoglobin YjbI
MRTHGWKATVLAACALALACSGGLQAQNNQAPPNAKELDKIVYDTLRDVINHGADLYNAGDVNACYRLYEGSLMTLKPLLGYRPALQKAIDTGLATARANANLDRRAFDLRAVIDRIRETVNPNPKPPPVAKTLWDRLGGEANVRKVVDDFVGLAAGDPKVDFFRGGKYKLDAAGVVKLKQLLVEFISSATGGPLKYTGKSMKESHKGMGITDAQFNAIATDLKTALEKNSAKPADVTALLDIVGTTRKDIVEEKKPEPKPMTLWDRLGGEANVRKVVDDFVAAAAKDKKVDFDRGGKYPLGPAEVKKLKQLLVEFISSATKGPLKYTGKSMKESHKGMGITDAQFDAAAADLKTALEKNSAKPADVKALLDIVGTTRKDIVEEKKPEPKPTTLWDRLGGEANVRKVVDDFVAAAAKDKKVDFDRGGKYPLGPAEVKKLKDRLVEMISSVSGGPLKYTGKSMKEAHKGMNITDAQFDATVAHLKTALEKNSAKPADVKAVLDVVEKTRKDIVEEK